MSHLPIFVVRCVGWPHPVCLRAARQLQIRNYGSEHLRSELYEVRAGVGGRGLRVGAAGPVAAGPAPACLTSRGESGAGRGSRARLSREREALDPGGNLPVPPGRLAALPRAHFLVSSGRERSLHHVLRRRGNFTTRACRSEPGRLLSPGVDGFSPGRGGREWEPLCPERLARLPRGRRLSHAGRAGRGRREYAACDARLPHLRLCGSEGFHAGRLASVASAAVYGRERPPFPGRPPHLPGRDCCPRRAPVRGGPERAECAPCPGVRASAGWAWCRVTWCLRVCGQATRTWHPCLYVPVWCRWDPINPSETWSMRMDTKNEKLVSFQRWFRKAGLLIQKKICSVVWSPQVLCFS